MLVFAPDLQLGAQGAPQGSQQSFPKLEYIWLTAEGKEHRVKGTLNVTADSVVFVPRDGSIGWAIALESVDTVMLRDAESRRVGSATERALRIVGGVAVLALTRGTEEFLVVQVKRSDSLQVVVLKVPSLKGIDIGNAIGSARSTAVPRSRRLTPRRSSAISLPGSRPPLAQPNKRLKLAAPGLRRNCVCAPASSVVVSIMMPPEWGGTAA